MPLNKQTGRGRARTGAVVGRPRNTGWRRQLDSFGGPTVIGALGLGLLGLVLIAIQNGPTSVSDTPLIGDPVVALPAPHVADASQIPTRPGLAPAGGPHLLQPQRAGTYEQPIPDGNAVHSLEHGMVWISYRPDLIASAELELLQRTAKDYADDVMLSPRPGNNEPVNVVSWGRRLEVRRPFEQATLAEFIRTNRNRSPEPGIR